MTNDNTEKLKKLIARWRKDADQYMRQVEEARAVGTPYDQMLSGGTFLRQCAKELEQEIGICPPHILWNSPTTASAPTSAPSNTQ